jgi:hypothetical protein
MQMTGPTSTTITYPSATTTLSESGQYALTAMVSNPVLLTQLNFENNYVDSANGLATGVLSGTTANVTFTSTSKVGSTSLAVTNIAAAQSNLGYVNYTIPPGHPLRSPTLLTIAFWMYPTSSSVWPNQSSPLGFNNGTNGAGPYFYLASVMSFAYYTSTSTFGAIAGTTTIAQSTWIHVAITYSNGNLILYDVIQFNLDELRILDFQLFVVELITKQLVLRVEETNHVLHSFICAFGISYFHQKCNDEVTRLCSFVQLIKIRILRAY